MRRGLFQVKTPRSRSSALLCAVTRPDQRAPLPPLGWLTDKISFRESSSRCAASGLRTATRVTAGEQELSSLWFSAGSGLSYTGGSVPEVETIERAREDAREGKSPSTQAGEFVRRGDAPRPGGQTRCKIDQASHRHWAFEGQTVR